MNKLARAAIFPMALLVALLAAGCATRVAGAPAAGGTTSKARSDPPAAERELLALKVGQGACFGPAESATCDGGVTFYIDEIVVDPPCTEYGHRDGHTLVLTLRVATDAHAGADMLQQALRVFNAFSFKVIGADGNPQEVEFGSCAGPMHLPTEYQPGKNYLFKLELDAPVAHGVLALQPGIVGEDGTGGWEWKY